MLGIGDLKRHEPMPGVPTLPERGCKSQEDATTNFRRYAPGTGKAIVEKAPRKACGMFKDPVASGNPKKTGVPCRSLDRKTMLDIFAKREASLKDLLKDYAEK